MKTWGLPILLGIMVALAQNVEAQITVDVHIYNLDFGTAGHTHLNPTIEVGDTIHWIWDNIDHSTTAAAGQAESWDSGVKNTIGATFDHTFTHIGTFNYYCTMHGLDDGNGQVSGMSGFITVVPEPQAWGAATGLLLLGLASYRYQRARRGQRVRN